MDKKFVVDIYTPTGHYLKTWADYLSVTTGLGVVGILPNHAPLVTTIEVSKLVIKNEGVEHLYAVSDGFMHIKKGTNVILMVNSIERSDEIDIERALAAKKRAESRLDIVEEETDVTRAKAALSRALNRISIYEKK